MISIKNYINGQFVDAHSKRVFASINPAIGKQIATVPDSEKTDVESAVKAASNAFGNWSKASIKERADILYQIADLIDQHANELAQLESEDQGKPIRVAATVDIPRAAKNFRFFAGAILHEENQFHNPQDGSINYSLRQPVGVTGLISPWNLPLYLLTWKIAPAIAVGNTCVAKPSEITPLTAFRLSELISKTSLPDGVVNIVHGYGHTVGDAITSHPDIPLISFTGGTITGKKVYLNAAEKFKKVSLELGGKNPTIIFADANYKKALSTSVRASFSNQGEICLCGSRIFVEETIYQKFLTDFIEKTKSLTVGDPTNEKIQIGAIASQAHLEKIQSYIDLAKTEGGTIECGGKRPENLANHLKNGYFLEPTVISGLDQSCRVLNEEIFGPVVTITPFKSEKEVIDIANSTEYGLSASIWTQDLNKAHRVSAAVDSGIIWVNTWLNRDLRTPFGGMRHSGVGREGGRYSLEFYTKVKNICIDLDPADD